MANIDKLNQLASSNSKWIDEAKKRQENRDWQKHSQKIAIKILMSLREKGIKQKDLAKMIGVSPQQINKIVKGKENLTLQTIAKIENALNIELIFEEKQKTILKESIKKEFIVFERYNNPKFVSKKTVGYSQTKNFFSDSADSEKAIYYG